MINANFSAELHCRYGQVVIADTNFSESIFTSADEDGWLCTEVERNRTRPGQFKPVVFQFSFLSQEKNRWHYLIHCEQHWDYSGAVLDSNANGWLGLYGTHVFGRLKNDSFSLPGSQPLWKIQPLASWDGDLQTVENIPFHLRDSRGYRVAHTRPAGSSQSSEHYLAAGDLPGEILEFNLRNIWVS